MLNWHIYQQWKKKNPSDRATISAIFFFPLQACFVVIWARNYFFTGAHLCTSINSHDSYFTLCFSQHFLIRRGAGAAWCANHQSDIIFLPRDLHQSTSFCNSELAFIMPHLRPIVSPRQCADFNYWNINITVNFGWSKGHTIILANHNFVVSNWFVFGKTHKVIFQKFPGK